MDHRSRRKPDLHARRSEWSLVRRTATLGDVVDEATFVKMLGVPLKTFRWYHTDGEGLGIPFPKAIARPQGMKPIWLKSEADEFITKYRGASRARRRKT